MKVSIVIPTSNRGMDLKRCIDSLVAQTYKNFEIIVADDNSTDGTKELVERYSIKYPVRFVIRKKKGLVFARNLGWQIANGDIVTYVDDDIVASPTWLQEIVNTFRLSNKIGGVAGPTIIPEDKKRYRDLLHFYKKFREESAIHWRLFKKIYENVFLEGKPLDVGRIFRSGAFSLGSNFRGCLTLNEPVEVDYLEACNMSYRRSLIKEVGGFDDQYIETAEWNEPDLCFRMRKLGYKLIFNPKVIVEHHVSQSGVYKSRTHAYERSINFIHFYFKNIKPNTLDKTIRFSLYVMFMNAYWFYKFATTKNPSWLTGLIGTFSGLIRHG